jgi:hypothetical protein
MIAGEIRVEDQIEDACCTPADPTLVSWRNGVGSGWVYGGGRTFTVPWSSMTSMRPSGRNSMLVGRSNPVARISFWNWLVLATLTVTGAESVVFPASSRALAVSVWEPFATVRVSQGKP